MEDTVSFAFSENKNRTFEVLQDKTLSDLLKKWGLDPNVMQIKAFQFDELFQRACAQRFMQDFFQSPAVAEALHLADGRGGLTPFPHVAGMRVKQVEFKELRASVVSLDFFDKLRDNNDIVRPSGEIARMIDNFLPCGVCVADQLRGLFMLGEESEFCDVFGDNEKREFLYHVMWRIVAGGSLNQWEDNFEVYLNFARDMYKDLVAVTRNKDSNEIEVTSLAYQVEKVELGGDLGSLPLFPKDDGCFPSNSNFFYFVINPTRREVIVWYHGFWSGF